MAHTVHGPIATTHTNAVAHWALTFLAVIGVVAAALGAWMEFGSGETSVTVLWWSWEVSSASEVWAAWLMILGGLLTTVAIGWEAFRDEFKSSRWLLAFEGVIAVAGISAFVVGVFQLF